MNRVGTEVPSWSFHFSLLLYLLESLYSVRKMRQTPLEKRRLILYSGLSNSSLGWPDPVGSKVNLHMSLTPRDGINVATGESRNMHPTTFSGPSLPNASSTSL